MSIARALPSRRTVARSSGGPSQRHAGTRSIIRDFGWILTALGAMVAFYLGYRGFTDAARAPGEAVASDKWLMDPTNRVYATLQLFLLDSPSVDDPTRELDIARFLAPVVAGVATIGAVLALFKERAQSLHARFFARNHIVVVGAGVKGFHLVQALDANGSAVVVVEVDGANPAIVGCRERGVAVVIGDGTDDLVLRRAGVSRASHLVVVCGDDDTNVNVLSAAQRSMAAGSRRPLEVLVHIDDPDLRQVVQARAIELWSRSTVLLESFNIFEDVAAEMLEEQPFEGRIGDRGSPELLIVGVGLLGQALASQAAQRWQARRSDAGPALTITLVGPDARHRCATLRAQAPGLAQLVELHCEDAEISALDLAAVLGAKRSPTIVYVTAATEVGDFAAAFALHRIYAGRGIPIVVAVRDDRSGVASTLDNAEITGLHDVRSVALLSSTLTPELLRRRTREIIARTRHEQHLRDELAKGRRLGQEPSLVPWDELEQRFKDSNRDFADGVGATIEKAGCTLVPRPLIARGNIFSFGAEELEELAEKEHERWCRAEAARNPAHPSLVPWDHLPEEEKEKDRQAIKAVPELLARAGFEMRSKHGTARGPTPEVPSEPDGHETQYDSPRHDTGATTRPGHRSPS